MKNIYLPTRLLRHHLVARIIKKDLHFRGFCFFNTILLLADSFHFGDWWANGKRDMPFTWYPDKDELFFHCGIKTTADEKKYYQMMNEFNEVGILVMNDNEHYMRLEFPDLMKYVDKTNEDDIRDKIGKKEDWAKGIIEHSDNGDNYLEETSNQSKLNNIKLKQTKTNTSNNIDNNIRDINSSSPQAPSDKGSDDDEFDSAYWEDVGRQNVEEMKLNELKHKE